MARLAPLDRASLTDFSELFAGIEASGNVVPNSMLTMARHPALLRAYAEVSAVVFAPGAVPAALKRMIAHVASRAAGCRYCAAHNELRAAALGVSEAKVAELWTFESSALFDEAEKAALRVALAAGQPVNAVTDELFAALRRHYDEVALVEITAALALSGFTNRWNDTLATDMEAPVAAHVARSADAG